MTAHQLPTLIGLTGYAGSGKDTVRAILGVAGYHGLAFADPMRDMIIPLLTENGIETKYIYSREFKEAIIPELGVSYRQMVQTLGTEWGRALHPQFWLRLAAAHMENFNGGLGMRLFCISDVRLADEADWVRERGGVIWRIERQAAVPVRAHASEAEIYHIVPDVVIHNDGTTGALRDTVVQLLNISSQGATL